LALQCLLSLRKQQRRQRGAAGEDRSEYLSEANTSLCSKRRRPLASTSLDSEMLQSPYTRRCIAPPPHTPASPAARAPASGASPLGLSDPRTVRAVALLRPGSPASASFLHSGVNDSAWATQLEQQELLHHSIDWHIDELRRCVDRLVSRNLCPHDLSLHLKDLLESSNAEVDA